jgi:hypothetical protein
LYVHIIRACEPRHWSGNPARVYTMDCDVCLLVLECPAQRDSELIQSCLRKPISQRATATIVWFEKSDSDSNFKFSALDYDSPSLEDREPMLDAMLIILPASLRFKAGKKCLAVR